MRNFIHINELNEVMSCTKSEKSKLAPGMCATKYVGSDRYPMVVIKVISPKTIRVSHIQDQDMDKIVMLNDIQYLPHSIIKKYVENDHPDQWGHYGYNAGTTYTLRKNGRWMPKGDSMWGTCSIHVGHADNYRDPSF